MLNYKKLLTEKDINDIDIVSDYISKSFNKRRPKKCSWLYMNIANIYGVFPAVIEDILNNLPRLGYYKDYFHILSFSKNNKLDDYIYNIVIRQLNDDLKNLKSKKPVSTLGKWLPSEGSKINKKINFIDKFNAIFWEQPLNKKLTKFTLRKKYRQMKTMLNEHIGTLESLMCIKGYDKINLNKVSPNALKKHKHHLVGHTELSQKINEYELDKLIKMNLFEFTKELFEDNYDIQTLEQVWAQNNYHFKIPYLNKLIDNTICVLDLSKDMFTNDAQYLAIGFALLIDKVSKQKNNIIVCNDNIIKFDVTDSLIEKKNKLLKYSGPSKPINVNNYKQMIKSTDKYALLFITNKKIEFNKSDTMMQIIPYYNNNYEIICFSNGTYKKSEKLEEDELTSDRIKSIIKSSDELNDKSSHLVFIGLAFLVWAMVFFFDYLFLKK